MENFDELLKLLSKEWQDWVSSWPENLRFHALLVAVSAEREGLSIDRVFEIVEKHPELQPVILNMFYHLNDETRKQVEEILPQLPEELAELVRREPEEFLAVIALSLGEQSLSIPDEFQDRVERFTELIARFERTGDRSAIDSAIELAEEMLHDPKIDSYPDLKLAVEGDLAGMFSRRGEFWGDLEDIEKSISIYESISSEIQPSHPIWASIKNNLGNAYLDYYERTGDIGYLRRAIEHYASAVEILEQLIGTGSLAEQRHLREQFRGSFYGPFRYHVEVSDFPSALEWLERTKGFELRSLASNLSMPSETVPEELREKWMKVNDELRRFRVTGENWGKLKSLLEHRQELIDEIKRYKPHFDPDQKPLRFGEMLGLVDPGTAVVEISLLTEAQVGYPSVEQDVVRCFVMFGEPEEPSSGFQSDKSSRLHFREIGRFDIGTIWSKTVEHLNNFSEPQRTLEWLWDEVIGEVATYLESKGIKRVIIVPHRYFHILPLHAAYDRENSRFFMDMFDVAVVPSLWLLKRAKDRLSKVRPSNKLLAVANPDGTLHFSDREVDWISALWEGDKAVLRHDEATKTAIAKHLPDSAVIHFSTHGSFMANYDSPLYSYLLVSGKSEADRRLTVEELLREYQLRAARLAVLSACETGQAEFLKWTDPGFGLPAAFMLAGAPAVVGTLWPVDDLSTALLIRRFYENWLSGDSVSTALRRAQRWLREVTVGELRDELEMYRDELRQIIRGEEIEEGLAEAVTRLAEGIESEILEKYMEKFPELKAFWSIEKLIDMDDHKRPFENPYRWAGFVPYGLAFEKGGLQDG